MANPPAIGGPRATTVNPNVAVRPQTEPQVKNEPQTTPAAKGAWTATGAQNGGQRVAGDQGSAGTTAQSGIDEQTRTLVRSTYDQLKTANQQLAQLSPRLQQAQAQLVQDKKAVPWGETLNPLSRGPMEQKVDATQAKINQLTGELNALQGRVGQLDGQINSAIGNALKADPQFKSRGDQLATLGRAEQATKSFLGQIDETKKALDRAQSSISSDSMVDGLNALGGNPKDATQQALDQQRELQKAHALANASAKFSTLPTFAEAWKTQIQTLTNESVTAGNTGTLNAQVNTWLPLTNQVVSPEFARSMGAMDNMNNAAAIGKAQGKVEVLRDNVQGYQDSVTSKMRTLQTTQNNAVAAARTQAIQ